MCRTSASTQRAVPGNRPGWEFRIRDSRRRSEPESGAWAQKVTWKKADVLAPGLAQELSGAEAVWKYTRFTKQECGNLRVRPEHILAYGFFWNLFFQRQCDEMTPRALHFVPT